MNNKKMFLSLALTIALVLPSLTSAELADIDPQAGQDCVAIQNNLRYRSTDAQTNNEVSMLQDYLQANSYLDSNPTGFFGLLTFAAVKKFQAANSISPTGYVGPLTRAQIKSLSCSEITTSTPNTPPVSTPPISNTTVCGAGVLFNSQTGARCADSNATSACPAGFTCGTSQSTLANTYHLTSSITPSDAVINSYVPVQYQVTFDSNKAEPISMSLQLFCPAGVSANIAGEDVPRCNKTTIMSAMPWSGTNGQGDYRVSLNFTNTNSSSQTVGATALVNSGIAVDKDALTIRSTGRSTGSPVVTPVITAQPSITIANPTGGESFTESGPIRISWKASGGSSVSVYLMYPDGGACYLGAAPMATGYFTFTPANYKCKNIDKTVTAGRYRVGLFLHNGDDNERGIAQSYSSDFSITGITGSSASGDLVVSDFSWAPVSPSTNQADPYLYFTASFKNLGGGSVFVPSGTQFTAISNGAMVGQLEIGTGAFLLSAGESKTFTFTSGANISLLSTSGQKTITLVVDSNNLVLESNENNNSLTKQITVTSPAIVVIPPQTPSVPAVNTCLNSVMGTKDSDATRPLAISILTPNGGESAVVGKPCRITWSSSARIDKVTLGYSFGEGSLNWIANNILNTGYYDWNVSVGNTTNTRVKIYIIGYQTGTGSVQDYSNDFFTVNK